MSNILTYLFTTSEGSLFLGLSFMAGVISTGLSLGFLTILRHKALFYFSISNLIVYITQGLANSDPQQLFDVGGHPVFLRLLHLLIATAIFFYYRLILEIFSPLPSPKYFPSMIFHFLAFAAFLSRIVATYMLSELAIRIAAFSVAIFLLSTIVYAISYTSSKLSIQILRAACVLSSIGVSFYPFIRSGVPLTMLSPYMAFVTIGVLSTFSVTWLFGLVELAREAFQRAESATLRNMARAFLQLRDLMNTPLQTMEFSVAILRSGPGDEKTIVRRMENALLQMRRINLALAQYEKHIDWQQNDDFFNVEAFDPLRRRKRTAPSN